MKTVQKLIERMLNISSGVKTYNTNNGTLRVEWRKCLCVTALTLTIHTTSTWGTGSGNRITCTLDNDIPLPASIANGSELNGILCHISGSTFRAQNNTGSTLPANSNFNPTLTYLIGGGYGVTSLLLSLSERWWKHEQIIRYFIQLSRQISRVLIRSSDVLNTGNKRNTVKGRMACNRSEGIRINRSGTCNQDSGRTEHLRRSHRDGFVRGFVHGLCAGQKGEHVYDKRLSLCTRFRSSVLLVTLPEGGVAA